MHVYHHTPSWQVLKTLQERLYVFTSLDSMGCNLITVQDLEWLDRCGARPEMHCICCKCRMMNEEMNIYEDMIEHKLLMYIYIFTHAYTRIHTHIYIYNYIYIYMYIHIFVGT